MELAVNAKAREKARDVKNGGNELGNSFGIKKSLKNELKTNWFLHEYDRKKRLSYVRYGVSDVLGVR